MFDYCKYAGKSSRSDRMFGLSCGCVVIVRGFSLLTSDYTVQSEWMHRCYACEQEIVAPAANPALLDAVSIVAYDMAFHDSGVPWQ